MGGHPDDVIVKGRSFPEHLNNVHQVLDRIWECGFTLNALKCHFFQVKLPYLGHVIENGNISLDPERIYLIIDFPVPTNVKALCRFIGMVQFCSRFILHLNVELAPLYHLTRKNVPYDWTSECQTSFDFVKEKLTTAPVLPSRSTSDSFILETDASDLGIGCCLKASSGNGEEFIVGYDSAKLSDTEYRWNIVEKEAFSIIEATKKFRHYLIGKKFTLHTDSRILTYLQSKHLKSQTFELGPRIE